MTYEKELKMLKNDLRKAIRKAQREENSLELVFKHLLEDPEKRMKKADFVLLADYVHGVTLNV